MFELIGPIVLGLHLSSVHFPVHAQNNVNLGIYARVDGWQVGAYYNSIRRPTVYLAHTWEWGPWSLAAGLGSGYQEKNGNGFSRGALTPFAAPSYLFDNGFRVTVLPGNSTVVHLSYERKF
jgi:hypothetical protein